MAADGDGPVAGLDEALAMQVDGDEVRAHVHDGWDVFGIPHGGYVAAIAARAAMLVAEAPDLLTTTTHFHRKAATGPVRLEVTAAGGSRRLRTMLVRARQGDDGAPLLTALVCVGDRATADGPRWGDLPRWEPVQEELTPPAGDPSLPFTPPRVAERFGLRLDRATAGFAAGATATRAAIRALAEVDGGDDGMAQLAALVVCDVTPPAVWNVLGAQGWVPTVELTAHVRARPAPGPLAVDVTSHHVADGFLDEDAVVRDATGQVVVMSRQLAMWPGG